MNTQNGLAGTLIERICLKYNEEANINGASAVERKKKRQETAKEQLVLHGKRVSFGLLVASGQYQIDETVHGYVRRVEDKRKEQEQLGQQKKREMCFKLQEKVHKVREKGNSPDKWNSSDLAIMIQWFRRKGDAAIPKTVAERRQRYLEVCGQGDPQVPELLDYGIPLNDALIPPTEYNTPNEDEAAMHKELELTAKLGRDDAAMLLLFASTATADDAATLLLFVSNEV